MLCVVGEVCCVNLRFVGVVWCVLWVCTTCCKEISACIHAPLHHSNSLLTIQTVVFIRTYSISGRAIQLISVSQQQQLLPLALAYRGTSFMGHCLCGLAGPTSASLYPSHHSLYPSHPSLYPSQPSPYPFHPSTPPNPSLLRSCMVLNITICIYVQYTRFCLFLTPFFVLFNVLLNGSVSVT